MAEDHGTSIKDDEQYEKLRERGESKQKAARIAHTGHSTMGKRVGPWAHMKTRADVLAPPLGELFSETNDNSGTILLNYDTARVLFSARGQGRERRRTWRTAPIRGLKRLSRFETTKQTESRFRALLIGGAE